MSVCSAEEVNRIIGNLLSIIKDVERAYVKEPLQEKNALAEALALLERSWDKLREVWTGEFYFVIQSPYYFATPCYSATHVLSYPF